MNRGSGCPLFLNARAFGRKGMKAANQADCLSEDWTVICAEIILLDCPREKGYRRALP
jgi:hypothetical protein